MRIVSSIRGEMEKAPMTHYLIGTDQETTDWLMKIVFLGEAETVVRSGINLGLVSWTLTQMLPFGGLWFSL